MKILVFSDLHGNLINFRKLQIIIEENEFDLILILGDLFSNRSQSNYYDDEYICFALNQYAYKIRMVRGNCDYNYELFDKLDFDIRDYDELILKDKKIVLTHGHRYSRYDFDLKENDIFLSGHTHMINSEIDGVNVKILNPGSVGDSRGFEKESYLVLDDDKITFFDIDNKILSKYCL